MGFPDYSARGGVLQLVRRYEKRKARMMKMLCVGMLLGGAMAQFGECRGRWTARGRARPPAPSASDRQRLMLAVPLAAACRNAATPPAATPLPPPCSDTAQVARGRGGLLSPAMRTAGALPQRLPAWRGALPNLCARPPPRGDGIVIVAGLGLCADCALRAAV